MNYNILLDEIFIGMGMFIMVLSVVLYIDVLMPIGMGAIVIGLMGLEAKSVKECIRESREER
jgi:hypothetical protein